LPIVFFTTLSAPATEIEIVETATLIEAEKAVAVIVDDSNARTSTRPRPVSTEPPSIRAIAESCTVLNAFAPAMLTATPTPCELNPTLRLAATAVAMIVAWSVAVTETEAATTGLATILALTDVAMSLVATAPARATAPAMPPLGAAATAIATPTGVAVIWAVFDALTTTAPGTVTGALSTVALTLSAIVFRATDALRLIAMSAPASVDAARLSDSDTVVAMISAESSAVTESADAPTEPFLTEADTVFPIELVTTLSAPAAATDTTDTAAAIEAEIAVAVILASSWPNGRATQRRALKEVWFEYAL